jgi:uncharacterized protein YihD (DUF1040 family)
MRSPQRIPKTLKKLEKIWKRNPELRFMQLIANIFKDDPYYVEDDVLIARLEEYYKEKK